MVVTLSISRICDIMQESLLWPDMVSIASIIVASCAVAVRDHMCESTDDWVGQMGLQGAGAGALVCRSQSSAQHPAASRPR